MTGQNLIFKALKVSEMLNYSYHYLMSVSINQMTAIMLIKLKARPTIDDLLPYVIPVFRNTATTKRIAMAGIE